MLDTVPDYMKYGQEKSLAESQKGGVGLLKDAASTAFFLFKNSVPGQLLSSAQSLKTAVTQGPDVATKESTNPTGKGVNFFNQTPGQRDTTGMKDIRPIRMRSTG
jgi:hypothetical protein